MTHMSLCLSSGYSNKVCIQSSLDFKKKNISFNFTQGPMLIFNLHFKMIIHAIYVHISMTDFYS